MNIFQISPALIERPEDNMFFDSKHYKIFRFNKSGIKIMEIAIMLKKFTRNELMSNPALSFCSEEDKDSFFEKCRDNKLFVQL